MYTKTSSKFTGSQIIVKDDKKLLPIYLTNSVSLRMFHSQYQASSKELILRVQILCDTKKLNDLHDHNMHALKDLLPWASL